MFTAHVDLSGFRTQWARTVDEMRTGMGVAVRYAAQEGAAEAKRVGPFQDRTTRLRTGIVAKFVANSGDDIKWQILSPMFYSRFVDRGTSRSRAFPFMGPAQIKAEQVLRGELGTQLRRRLKYLWPA